MGKIFEALEKAQREREKKGGKKPPLFVVSPGERPSDGFEVAAGKRDGFPFAEHRRPPGASPRKVIQFIGPQGGEGTSTVVRDFAMVSAARFGKSVLLLDARSTKPQSAPLLPPPTGIRVGGDLEKQEDLQKSDPKNRENEPVCVPDPSSSHPFPKLLLSRDQGILGRGEGKIRPRPDRLRPASASPTASPCPATWTGWFSSWRPTRPASPWRKT